MAQATNSSSMTFLFIMLFVVFLIMVIILVIALIKKRKESFVKPYRQLVIPSLRFEAGGNCTDGCIYRQRNRGVFVDSECENMCRNWYEGPDAQNKKNYFDSVTASINSGANVYQYGI